MMESRNGNIKVIVAILPRIETYKPPLNLAIIKACVESRNYTCECKDYNIEWYLTNNEHVKMFYSDEATRYFTSEEEFSRIIWPMIEGFITKKASELANSDAEVIGFSVIRDNRMLTYEICRRIKSLAPEKTIVVGGASYLETEQCIRALHSGAVDFVVSGEGEVTFLELLDWINNGGTASALREIKGIYHQLNGEVVTNAKRPNIAELDKIPFPSFSAFNRTQYDYDIIPICGSRGCINRCAFCSERNQYDRYRARSGLSIYEEIKRHYKETGCTQYQFVDSLMNGNLKELNALCYYLMRDLCGMISWGGNVIIRKQMTENVFKKMYRAGCRWVYLGVESGSQNVLRTMNKRFTVELAKETIRNAKESGIRTSVFFLVGFPTETEDDFRMSLEFISQNREMLDGVFAGWGCSIGSGTALHENPENFGITWQNGDWYTAYSTPRIREDRVMRIRRLCSEYGLLVGAPTFVKRS